MANSKQTGNFGEQLALNYLKQQGLHILAVNWRFGQAEIDIIAEEQGIPVFVEVKSRSSAAFGPPEAAVGVTKQRQIRKAAEAYIAQKNIETEIRFDIVAITYGKSGPEIVHIRDAFFGY
jgi:putative endonuclease